MRIRWLVFVLFLPAGLGLTVQLFGLPLFSQGGCRAVGIGYCVEDAPLLATQVLRLATLLLSIEQARAAAVDLRQIALVKAAMDDARLRTFQRLTWAVIGLELLGFYGAVISLGLGVLTVLVSQVLFNSSADIALFPYAVEKIAPWGLKARLPVVVANGAGLVLAICWLLGIAQWVSAIALLSLVLAYLTLKYGSTIGQPAPTEEG